MRKLYIPISIIVFALAFVALGSTVFAEHPGGGGAPLIARMTGAAEFPGPGHPTATGTALLRLNPGLVEICVDIETSGLAGTGLTITAAHIHPGRAGEAGGALINLPTPSSVTGASSDCVTAADDPDVTRANILAILQDPSAYYVNVHATPGFGPGAIRGQLERPAAE